MTKHFVFTVDLERDIPGVLGNSLHGVDEGFPSLRDFFRSHGIEPDLFVSGEVCTWRRDVLKELVEGFNVGSHGYEHQLLLNKSAKAQRDDIVRSMEVIEALTGAKVRKFRAPNFSASGTTISILEDLDYLVDSSVLPGRKMNRFRLFRLYDFQKAPRKMYHPSIKDIAKEDGTNIVEIPLTENPVLPGVPLGMGYLNKFGLKKTQQALSMVREEYVTFLIHSWEFVDLQKAAPRSPKDWAELCKENPTGLSELLHFLEDDWEITSFAVLHRMWSDDPDKHGNTGGDR